MVLSGELDLRTPPWPSVSEEAKDLVKSLLTRDPARRPTASQALAHPWLRKHATSVDDSQKPLDPVVLTRLQSFAALDKLRRAALITAARVLPVNETAALRELFDRLDVDGRSRDLPPPRTTRGAAATDATRSTKSPRARAQPATGRCWCNARTAALAARPHRHA